MSNTPCPRCEGTPEIHDRYELCEDCVAEIDAASRRETTDRAIRWNYAVARTALRHARAYLAEDVFGDERYQSMFRVVRECRGRIAHMRLLRKLPQEREDLAKALPFVRILQGAAE